MRLGDGRTTQWQQPGQFRLTTYGWRCWRIGHARKVGEDTFPFSLSPRSTFQVPLVVGYRGGAESSVSSGNLKGRSRDHFRESEPLSETATSPSPSTVPSDKPVTA